jgi:N utilization substance protein A
MQSPLQAAINQICAEKNIDREIVLNAIESAVSIAYKKDFGRPTQTIEVQLGDSMADLKIFEVREVVEKLEDYDTDITLKDARRIRPDAALEQTVYVPIKLDANFGRIAAQTAKQVITQQLHEAENKNGRIIDRSSPKS